MTKVACTEINNTGLVVAVSKPNHQYLSDILPYVGFNLLHFGDDETSGLLKEYVELIFSSDCPIVFDLIIKSYHIQLTAHRINENKAFIYWNSLSQNTIPAKPVQQDWGFNEEALQKKLNLEFLRREHTIKRFTDNLPLVVFEICLFPDGRFEFGFVNKEMQTFFPGFNREAINANNNLLFIRVHPDDKQMLFDSIKNCFNLNTWDVEYRIIVNGEHRWVKGYGRPEVASDGKTITVCAYLQDVTEKKKILEELELIDFSFRHSVTPMIFIKADGSFLDFNEAAYKLLGYTEKEFKELRVPQINPNYNEHSWKTRWELLRTKRAFTFTTQLKRKDGRLVNVEAGANIIEFSEIEVNCAVITDITEKRKIEERLNLVDFVFKRSNVPIIIAREDSTFYDFNDAALELHGYSAREMAKMRVGNLVVGYKEEDWDTAFEEVWANLKANKTFEATVQHRKKDGTIIDVEIRANYITYGDLELNCSFIIDITDKKKAERTIKRSNERYEYATLATHDIVWETDLINDTLYFGSNFKTVFGHETTGVEPGPNNVWRNNIHPDDVERVLANELEVINGNGDGWETEYRFRKSDGHLAIVLDRGFGLKDENGKTVRLIGAMQDITEKRKIEDELKRSNERYEYATLATSDVIWEADLIENTIYISKNFTNVFGHQITGVMPIKNSIWRHNVYPDDLINVLKSEAEVIKENGDRWECEYRFRKADGSYAIVLDRGFAVKDANGNVVKMIGAMQDITRKKQEEERIKLFETVIENTTDAIIIRESRRLSSGGFPILYVNRAFEEMTGFGLDEIKGNTLQFLNGPLTDRQERVNLRTAMDALQPARMEVINYKKDGQTFWANISVFPVKDKTGNITHWVSIQRDVTLKRKAEEEREQLINELIHNNKELKQFGYITTHNLRAPLTNLLSICRMIDIGKIEDKRSQRLVEGFKQSTLLLNETLNDLIEILIIKENRNLNTIKLNFEDVFKKVQNSISNSIINANATIEADFAKATSINFSNAYLESIFLNLLTNSIKYAHPERTLEIGIRTEKGENNTTKLYFSDNGIGIDIKRVKDRIFGLYQRFHNNTDSKGIGLYLIHSQITALGGTIEVESEVNVGTTFTITFK
jgi:PAS domain S-box-containing protein